jgi:S-ribosylhomocysteine lyase
MEKIASFTVNHLDLFPGLYVSRMDRFGDTAITTFDMRFKAPNREPVMDQPALHTIEHLGATFLRNHQVWAPRVVYFGPMGCRTGFYMILEGEVSAAEALPLVLEMLDFIAAFEGAIPGASAAECGNWQEQNLNMAHWEAGRYAADLRKNRRLEYPG